MNISTNNKSFNYQQQVEIAFSHIDQDRVAAKKMYTQARLMKKVLFDITQIMNSIDFVLIIPSLTHFILSNKEGSFFSQILLGACVTAHNSNHHTDARNESAFIFFNSIKRYSSNRIFKDADVFDFKNNGYVKDSEIAKLNELLIQFKKIGSVNEANTLLAAWLLQTHSTIQQSFARSLRNTMLEIAAHTLVKDKKVCDEISDLAIYIAANTQSISFPYI